MYHTLPSGAQVLEGVLRYAGRPVVRVRIPALGGLIQPFYRSTGQNSGMGGKWLPFDGLLALSPNDYWFDKHRFTGDRVKPDLQRYGNDLLRQIAQELDQVPVLAHINGTEATPKDINNWLGTEAGKSLDHFNTTGKERPIPPGRHSGTPLGPTPPPMPNAPPMPPSGPPSGGSGGSGASGGLSPSGSGGSGGSTPSGAAPEIRTVRPLTAQIGAQVRLNGVRLHLITGVTIGGVPATIYSQDRLLIVIVVPDNAINGPAQIQATYPGGTITAPGRFAVRALREEEEENPPYPPDSNTPAEPPTRERVPAGFWESVLSDPHVRGAVNRAAPSMRGHTNSIMEYGAGVLSGNEAAMSGQMSQILGLAGSVAGGYTSGRAAGTSGILSGVGSLAGGALAGPLGAAIGAAVGTLIEKAVQFAINNIHDMRDLGASSIGNLARGAMSVTTRVMDSGLQIGDTLLRATLKPFGQSGSAVAGFVGTVGQSFKGIFTAGMDLAAGGLKTAGGLAAGGVGIGMGLGGALIGTMMGGPVFGLIYGMVGTMVGKLMMSIVNGITGAIGGVFDAFGKALGEVGRVGGEALKGLLTILDDVKNAALGLSKPILDLSQLSGMSVGASATAVNNLQGFGISPGQTAQMFSQNVLYQRAIDRAWGIRGEAGSEQNLRDTRAVYQQLKASMNGNPLMANLMMQATGKDALIPMANLPSAAFNRSFENGRGLAMGVGAVLEWQQNFGLMQNDLGRFAEYVKVTLGNAFLPSLQRGLGLAVGFFKSNQDAIVGGIRAVGRWFYADLPDMVLGGASRALGGFSALLRGVGDFISGLGTSGNAINTWVGGFLGGIDRIVYAFREAISIGQGAAVWLDPTVLLWNKPQEAEHARLDSMRNTSTWQTQLQNQWKRATAPQYDAQGNLIPNGFQQAGGWINDKADHTDGIQQAIQSWQNRNNPKQRGNEYNRFFGSLQGEQGNGRETNLLEQIAENTGRALDVNANINLSVDPTSDFMAKVVANETWTQWQGLSARGAGLGGGS